MKQFFLLILFSQCFIAFCQSDLEKSLVGTWIKTHLNRDSILYDDITNEVLIISKDSITIIYDDGDTPSGMKNMGLWKISSNDSILNFHETLKYVWGHEPKDNGYSVQDYHQKYKVIKLTAGDLSLLTILDNGKFTPYPETFKRKK